MNANQRNFPLSLFVTVAISFRITSADPICYDTWGGENPDLVPCSSSDLSKSASCCNKDDYCLSNGLCLSTGVNNLMTQQGCTDKNWSQPCNRICGVDPREFSLSSVKRKQRDKIKLPR